MIDWLVLAPVVIVALLVVFVPGAVIGAALRLRGILLWGFAPAAGTAAIAVSAIALDLLGIRWGLWTAAAAIVVLAVLAALIGWALRVPAEGLGGTRMRRLPVVALVVGAVAGMVRMGVMIGVPGNFSQTNDATFHLNALHYIQASGSASSLTISGVLGTEGFYPAAWHGIASLVMSASGADEIHAANAVSLLIAGPIWSLSVAALVWASTGRRRAAALSAVFAPALFAFPFMMLDFGVLYPYALAIAILPGAVAVVPAWWRRRTRGGDQAGGNSLLRETLLVGVISLVGFIGIALAQPAVLLVWLLMLAFFVVGEMLASWPGASVGGRVLRVVVTLLIAAFGLVVWKALGALTSGDQWGPLRRWYQALGELVINSPLAGPAAFVVSALSIAGFIVAVRRPHLRWIAATAVGLAGLELVAVSVQSPLLRGLLLDPWYGDPRRLIGLMPLVAVVLAAIGAEAIIVWARRSSPTAAKRAGAVIVALVLVESAVWTAWDRIDGEDTYSTTAESFVSTDERALLEDLPKLVDEDAVIVGNPSAGAGFGYVLSGRDVIPRTWSLPNDEDFQVLRMGLVDAADDPAVCAAVDRLHVGYVLDFGPSDDGPGRWDMPGLTGFADAEGFTLVEKKGDASLWRITACGLGR